MVKEWNIPGYYHLIIMIKKNINKDLIFKKEKKYEKSSEKL
jgi:hypothetical protein